jgi:hypothetical protein
MTRLREKLPQETRWLLALVAVAAPASVALAAGWPRPGNRPSPAPVTEVATVSASNPLPAARHNETIAVSGAEIAKLAPSFDLKTVQIADASGRHVPSQIVDMDGDEVPDDVVFQADFAAGQSKSFRIRAGQRTPAARAEYKVYGRFARERHDDFLWENDLVAHRMYGPELETTPKEPLISSGIDTWVKRTPRLVVNDWLMTGDYHRDTGDGADFYGVGKSRGCGGLGIWAGGKLMVSRNFVSSRVLAAGPILLVFELRYAPWDAGPAGKIAETKRVVLDAGSAFNRFESTFTGGKAPLLVGIGIAKHAGSAVVVDTASASMRVWEPLKGKQGDDNGNLGCAVVLPSGAAVEEHHGDLDYLVVTTAPANGRLGYHMGSAWDRAGRIRTAEAWGREVQALAARAAAPIKIELAAVK